MGDRTKQYFRICRLPMRSHDNDVGVHSPSCVENSLVRHTLDSVDFANHFLQFFSSEPRILTDLVSAFFHFPAYFFESFAFNFCACCFRHIRRKQGFRVLVERLHYVDHVDLCVECSREIHGTMKNLGTTGTEIGRK